MRNPIVAFAILALLLLAPALRFYHIDVQSFWSDEGNSVAMAPRAPLDIVERSANDIHPPLYYLVLHGWAALTGTGEYVIRALSVLFSVITVALTVTLGLRVGGRWVALFAALIAALSPFAIHYAQEARMYAMVTMLATGSWLAFSKIWNGQGLSTGRGSRTTDNWHRASLSYIVLTVAMLYTQYYSVSVVVAQNLAWLWGVLWVRRSEDNQPRQSAIWSWFAIQVTVALLFLPWLLYTLDTILGWPAVSPPITPIFLAREVFRIFSFGLASEAMPLWVAIGFGGLLLLGLLVALRALIAPFISRMMGDQRHANAYHAHLNPALPLFIFLIPPLLMLVLSLHRPFWNPKFLLIALPGYHLLLGQGAATVIEWVERFLPTVGRHSSSSVRRSHMHDVYPINDHWAALFGGAIAFFFVLSIAPALYNEYWNPLYWRDDYRAIARTVGAQATAQDAVMLNAAGQLEIWEYYDESTLPAYALPATRPLDQAATVMQLEEIAQKHRRLWVLWWAEQEGDPEQVIPRWLDEHAFEAGSRWFGNVRLTTYRLGELPPPEPLEVEWKLPSSDASLRLEGVSVDPRSAMAGDVVAIDSVWASDAAMPVTFFAQLLDAGNHVVGQYDGDGGALPVAEWKDEENVRMGVPIAIGTPPGEYALVIGAYHRESGQRFVSEEGDTFHLSTVQVEAPIVPATAETLDLRHGEARDTTFGDVTLVGGRVNKLGSDHAPDAPLAAGDPLRLLLYWRAERDSPSVPPLALRLLDEHGAVVAEWPFEPTEGRYPSRRWIEQELVRDLQVRFLPDDLVPGSYRLLLTSRDRRVEVGTVAVQRAIR
ncbi:MAG: glycosyltransferase family 39 protein [Chloroflexota bacterium]|nr:glycosyltransferase family 39 protein [Chloroflexota bacterium]